MLKRKTNGVARTAGRSPLLQAVTEKSVDRRSFLRGTGLAIGLKLPPFGPGIVRAQDGSPEVTHWVVIRPDDTVVIRIARSEMGQGTLTGLAQLVAEELPKVRSTLGEAAWLAGKYAEGAALFEQITLGDYVEFLTLPAYEQIQ